MHYITPTGSMRLIKRVPCASAELFLVKLRFIGSSMVLTFLLPAASHGLLNVVRRQQEGIQFRVYTMIQY